MEERDLDKASVSLRLKGPDAVRYWHVMDAAKERQPYARLSDVIRELIGLDEPHILKPAEIQFFRSGNKEPDLAKGVPVATKSNTKLPLGNIHNQKRKTG